MRSAPLSRRSTQTAKISVNCLAHLVLAPFARFTAGKAYLHRGAGEDMSTTATVSSKGQVTLPKDLRRKHHLVEGERAVILDVREGILIRHGRKSMRGILKGRIDVAGMEKDVHTIRKEWRL